MRHVGVEKQRLIQTLDFYTANEMVWASPNYFERVYTRSEGSLGSQTTSISVYHATQYVHSLVQAMPKCVGKKERKQHLKKFMEQVKGGQIKPLVEKLKSIFLRPSALVKRWIDYLDKHTDRMQYSDYESSGLMRGSGIIESAIRRIINLRFKNASTFWLQENVEKLYFLRAALVAGRWDIVMENLSKST